MRTIIAGCRDGVTYQDIVDAMEDVVWWPSVIISGTARGADRFGERWAEEYGIPIERFPADWNKFGKSAGYKRNAEMAKAADGLVAIWDGKSRGTKHMIDLAEKAGIAVYIWRIDK